LEEMMEKMELKRVNYEMIPDSDGYFGEYGGSFIPEILKEEMDRVAQAYLYYREDEEFKDELNDLYKHYCGRATPLFYAKNLSEICGGGRIFLKREDLNHTGAHKLNHCLGEALLAKRMGKKRLLAETGAGQHGVALATAAALLGLECEIHMGVVDIEKEAPNVGRMKILGAKVVAVSEGGGSLKEAVDSAFETYMGDLESNFFAIGSVVGPHPYPMMVRDFQSIVGREAKEQFREQVGGEPDYLVAAVGGGSNAIGLFTPFLNSEKIKIYGVEPAGTSLSLGNHAATLTLGTPGVLHGFRSYLLQDSDGNPHPVNTCASGLDYPGVGPIHSYLKDLGRVNYHTINDSEAIDAFYKLSEVEGIIPALESAHAVAFGMKLASRVGRDESIIINLSGRGDKDLEYVLKNYPR
jgi:tryptophan synthase beta chain